MQHLTDDGARCRVLQVFSNLGLGGAEKWLIALLRFFYENKTYLPLTPTFDICLTHGIKGELDDQASEYGARLFYVRYSRQTMPAFAKNFRGILSAGRYDVVHDHQELTAGFHFFIGLGLLPRIRIAHFHNPLLHMENYSQSFSRRTLVRTGRGLLARTATHIAGTSRQLLKEYGFDAPRFDRIHQVAAYCGFDVSRFQGDRAALHSDLCCEFNWPNDVTILLFVGRLDSHDNEKRNQKNPSFALEIARSCISKNERVRFLMAGAGDEKRRKLESRIIELGLSNRIRLIGPRSDVPRLMLGSDLLLIPSLAEGLGMVAVEAQSAGLPVLASEAVPRECVVIPEMVRFRSLTTPPSLWADEAIEFVRAEAPLSSLCNKMVSDSHFSIENSAQRLVQLYTDNKPLKGPRNDKNRDIR